MESRLTAVGVGGVVGLGWWVEGLSKKEKEKKTYGHRQQCSDWQGGGER